MYGLQLSVRKAKKYDPSLKIVMKWKPVKYISVEWKGPK
ncbi:hypothetical protein ADICYQ_2894 [Cyclobacterium qasimii M12-11B]|uniref:Uncharacterized protein n=1 Tax=Cyclobacterium qasimii M12-11B TaxID=641524 RepID=S7WN83_9BACT|nr:hypothetical protein ADICYQ_2894 [Cyclobacterium qasimii M12-11B]